MQGTFHWLRVQAFCYSTEKEELIHDVMEELVGNDEFDCDISDGEHGNSMIIFKDEMTKQKEFTGLFTRLGESVRDRLVSDIENRVDEDCVFYLRLDKQKAVAGEYRIAHHGDVISVTGKVASHPARKEIAVKNLTAFLESLTFTPV